MVFSLCRGAVNPGSGKIHFPGQFHSQVAKQVQLIGIPGQFGFQAFAGAKFVKITGDHLLKAGSPCCILKGLARLAAVIAMIDIVEIACSGFVQIVKRQKKDHARNVRVRQVGQNKADYACAVGMFGHIFMSRPQKAKPLLGVALSIPTSFKKSARRSKEKLPCFVMVS